MLHFGMAQTGILYGLQMLTHHALEFFRGCNADQVTINISEYLNADFQAKFIYDDRDIWDWYVALDNVAIYVPPSDAVAQQAIGPVDACGMTANETVTFSVYNNGTNEIASFDASYSVNGGTPVSQTFSDLIPSAGTDTLSFAVPVDMTSTGTYTPFKSGWIWQVIWTL